MFWLLLAFVQPTYSADVLKCCPEAQSWDENAVLCVSNDSVRSASSMLDGISWEYNPLSCHLAAWQIFRVSKSNSVIDSGNLILTDLDNITFPPGSFCIDYSVSEPGEIVAHTCPCSAVPCVRKCCSDEEILNSDNVECFHSDMHKHFQPLGNPDEHVYYIHGAPACTEPETYLYKKSADGDPLNLTLENNGDIRISDTGTVIPFDSYCTDMTLLDNKVTLNILLCFKSSRISDDMELVRKNLYNVLLIIGSVFLLMTLVVQYSLSELRLTLHSKNLTSHTLSLLIGYIVLIAQSLGYTPSNHVVCVILGHLLQFAFLAAFFWLNVMCVDITWTFSGFRIPEGNSLHESEGKKYLYYSIYAWGSAAIIVLITFMTDMFLDGSIIAPEFGTQRCWFKGKLPTLLFFFLPITILLLINVALFIYTSLKIIKVRRDTVVLLRQDEIRPTCSNFQRFSEFRFSLYLKLSMLMGIAWLFEVITWAVDEEKDYFYLYILGDSINALRGVFVFFLFCRKRKLLELVRSKMTSASGIGMRLRMRKTKNSSTKSCPGDSSTLFSSNQTQQTHTE